MCSGFRNDTSVLRISQQYCSWLLDVAQHSSSSWNERLEFAFDGTRSQEEIHRFTLHSHEENWREGRLGHNLSFGWHLTCWKRFNNSQYYMDVMSVKFWTNSNLHFLYILVFGFFLLLLLLISSFARRKKSQIIIKWFFRLVKSFMSLSHTTNRVHGQR